MTAEDDRIDRAADLLRRLLGDPGLRLAFREDPSRILLADGLAELTDDVGDAVGMRTLDLRESRSSLAGVIAAAAAEGVGLMELARVADTMPSSDGARAAARVLQDPEPAPSGNTAGPRELFQQPGSDDPAPVRRDPEPEPEPDGETAVQRLLDNDRLDLPDGARQDLKAGVVDPRVVAVLERLVADHRIRLSVIQTGHDRFVAGTSQVSNHAVGRGFDIAAVDGELVSPGSAAARTVANELLQLPPPLRPEELGGPWKLGDPASFSDAAHKNHLHVAWDSEAPADLKVADPPEPKREEPEPERERERPEASESDGPGPLDSGVHQIAQQRQQPALEKEEPRREARSARSDPETDIPRGAKTPFAREIDAAAARHGIDPNLLRGLVRAESNFDPNAGSPAGAVGLCQLMPGTAAELGVTDRTDPEQSLDGGAKYLAQMLAKYDGDEKLALAAYNAGPGAVDQAGGIPVNGETEKYVPKVLGFAAEYRRESGRAEGASSEPEPRGRRAAREPEEEQPAAGAGGANVLESGVHAVASGEPAGGEAAREPNGNRGLRGAGGERGQSVGRKIVELAQGELGEREVTANQSARIAFYRQATQGSGVGPWCAYFVSWAAREARHPLGDQGQGFGLVSDVWKWAQAHETARAPGSGYTPKPGDLILFGGNSAHIGIVERVLPDGRIGTIEGNYSDQVARVNRSPSEASGFVRMG